jgi:hypothetical protein
MALPDQIQCLKFPNPSFCIPVGEVTIHGNAVVMPNVTVFGIASVQRPACATTMPLPIRLQPNGD